MPIVCIERPNRSRPRPFTVKDLERIAKNVQADSGLSPWFLIGSVAGALGIGVLLCKAAGLLRDLASIRNALVDLGITAAGLLSLRVVVGILSGTAKVVGRFNVALALLTTVIIFAERVIERISNLVDAGGIITEVIDGIDAACQGVVSGGHILIDSARELVEDDDVIVETPEFNI